MTRQQRRHEERRLKKGTIIQKLQVFMFTDEAGLSQKLDVEAMRRWAQRNLALELADVDLKKVGSMFENKKLNLEYLEKEAFNKEPQPILICLDFMPGKSEIVDGNHSYAAVAIAAIKASEMGIPVPNPLRIPAYCFDRNIWQQFLL